MRLLDPDGIADRNLRDVVTHLFGDGRSVPLGSATDLDLDIASAARARLMEALWLRHPATAPLKFLVGGMIVLILFGWIQLGLGVPGMGWWLVLAGLVAVMLLVAAAYYYPRYGRFTEKGTQVRDHLLGLQDFVTMADGERIAWLQNVEDAPREALTDGVARLKLYEPLLPYAIIFGAEQTWLQVIGALDVADVLPRVALPAMAAITWTDLARDETHTFYEPRSEEQHSFWESRPAWGEGSVAQSWASLQDSWSQSQAQRDEDRGGSWWDSGGGSSGGSSWSSGGSDSGSSGGGSAGGGMGGGGGGGW